MASDDFGRDLASVQALLRKHEGLERDLAALEDKVGETDTFIWGGTYLNGTAGLAVYLWAVSAS